MDQRTAVIAASFAMEAYRIRSSGLSFWNDAAADHAYREATAIADAFEAAEKRAKESGDGDGEG